MKTTETLTEYKTRAAYLSGAITGKLWMPSVQAGKLIKKDLRGTWGFFSKGDSFREALNSLLMREGGDFQNPAFTTDTILRVERIRYNAPGKYEVHVWEREIGDLCDCKDLVNAECYAGDLCD